MREIKFRAWTKDIDTDEFCMHQWNRNFFADFSKATHWSDEFPEPDDPDIILMQYTGLKDMNGKEIYEGDICSMKSFDTSGAFYVKGEVRYQPPEFCLRTANDYWELDYGDPSYIKIKIIGNIHENPELLEGR